MKLRFRHFLPFLSVLAALVGINLGLMLATPGISNKSALGFAWDPAPTNDAPYGFWLYVSTNLLSPFNYSPGVMTNQVSAVAKANFRPILYVDGGDAVSCSCPTNLLPGWPRGQWFFTLTVTNAVGESDFSNAAWYKGIPAAPTGLHGTGAL
jgi:hypothetical protein